jgi:hypothetical protein
VLIELEQKRRAISNILMKVAMERGYNDVIVVKGLTKEFGSITAVNSITFSVTKGEIFGFLFALFVFLTFFFGLEADLHVSF